MIYVIISSILCIIGIGFAVIGYRWLRESEKLNEDTRDNLDRSRRLHARAIRLASDARHLADLETKLNGP